MNDDSPDALDRLLGDWATSREADGEHTRRLADQILSAARDQAGQQLAGSATDVTPCTDRPVPASIHPASRSVANWEGRLMIGGGLLLLLMMLAGGLLYFNLASTPNINQRPIGPIAANTDPSESPAAATLGASDVAAMQRLLTETNALFDDQLAWIADGQREVTFELHDQAARGGGEFMLIRVVVARRASPDLPWSTVWQTDVISRNEALVEVAPEQLDGSSLALWTYLMSDGEVAVDMDLMLNQETQTLSSSSTVLQSGQPTRVGCSAEGGFEQCVFQTVMPLRRAQI